MTESENTDPQETAPAHPTQKEVKLSIVARELALLANFNDQRKMTIADELDEANREIDEHVKNGERLLEQIEQLTAALNNITNAVAVDAPAPEVIKE